MYLIAALLLGLLGSLHCVGMCGPIAIAIPVKRDNSRTLSIGIIIYNLGRAFTYSILGAISGLAGSAVQFAVGQRTLSISAGVIVLLVLILGFFGKRMHLPSSILSVLSKTKSSLGKLFSQRRPSALLLIGVLNGLLPCGLVYAGLAGAAATGTFLHGAMFMFVFGIGTIPALFMLSFAGSKISLSFRSKMKKAVPVFVGTMALLLVLRGLGLGIPIISPSFSDGKTVCPMCKAKEK
ncbi:MAG: sulfite exporter TauE/SafE family protein [Bacteroidetes bacterium]|nr:sulfite exporter TauE/SafE family protein [Bacteroidota bacterium]